jgi:hypothetical protein
MNFFPALLSALLFLASCQNKTATDTLYFNALFYTVDAHNAVAEALVADQGKILFTGSKAEALKRFAPRHTVNLNGAFVYPGFIDAHCHYAGYGLHLSQLDLVGTQSWEQVIDRVKAYAVSHPEGWIVGRGWDQNDWELKEFPTDEVLNTLFPDRPVYLQRIDGHAGLVNQKALELTGFAVKGKIAGGAFITRQGKFTGLLLDAAHDSISGLIPLPDKKMLQEALLKAQEKCFAVGLTTVNDAGVENYVGATNNVVNMIDSLQKAGLLKMRFYMMVYDESSKKYFLDRGPLITDRLKVRAFKFYSDGALGSRGALLLKPYSDAPETNGLQIKSAQELEAQARLCLDRGFQVCTHAIGDSANRMVLNLYGKLLGGTNDKRWRIEHCQVIAPDDFELFHRYSIIPSVQATHATSDMYWAVDRLGVYRVKGAYAYRDLMKANGWIANGSDFPVEDINPLFGFYAAVARMDQKGFPEKGFQAENALTREEALRAMTIWAARANFEENEKGSLEAGKFADFVVLEKDILQIPIEETFSVKVVSTFVNGEKVY